MMRAPARCGDHVSSDGANGPDRRRPDLAVRDRRGELLDRTTGGALDRDSGDATRMDSRPSCEVLGAVPPASNDDRIRGEFVHCPSFAGRLASLHPIVTQSIAASWVWSGRAKPSVPDRVSCVIADEHKLIFD